MTLFACLRASVLLNEKLAPAIYRPQFHEDDQVAYSVEESASRTAGFVAES